MLCYNSFNFKGRFDKHYASVLNTDFYVRRLVYRSTGLHGSKEEEDDDDNDDASR